MQDPKNTKQNKQNKTKQNKTKQSKAKQGKAKQKVLGYGEFPKGTHSPVCATKS